MARYACLCTIYTAPIPQPPWICIRSIQLSSKWITLPSRNNKCNGAKNYYFIVKICKLINFPHVFARRQQIFPRTGCLLDCCSFCNERLRCKAHRVYLLPEEIRRRRLSVLSIVNVSTTEIVSASLCPWLGGGLGLCVGWRGSTCRQIPGGEINMLLGFMQTVVNSQTKWWVKEIRD